jgi:hypothetical protein
MRRWWPYAVLLLLACAPYARVVTHEFLNWDDPWLVRDNPLLADPGADTLRRIFFDFSPETRMTLGAEYLPVRDVSILIGKQIWGDWAGGFLLVNLLLYGGAVLLLFRLIERLHGSRVVAFLAALFYAVHPIHVESVAWISSRKDMLSLLFFLASLVAVENHLRGGRRGPLLLACLFYWFALQSKYVAIVLPAFVALRLVWLYLHDGDRGRLLRRAALVLTPLAVISAACLALILRVGSQADVLKERAEQTFGADLATTVDVLRRYLYNLILPLRLSPDYHVDPVTSLASANGALLAGVAVLLAVALAWVTWCVWSRPEPGRTATWFWVVWFFAALLPVSQIAPIYNRMTDRYLLLPSISVAVLTAYWGHRLWLRTRLRGLVAVGAVYALLLIGLTVRQVAYWQDSLQLWQRAAAMQPASVTGWYQLSTVYREKKMYAEEGRSLERALAAAPQFVDALANLGVNLSRRGAPIAEIRAIHERLFRQEPMAAPEPGHRAALLRGDTQPRPGPPREG